MIIPPPPVKNVPPRIPEEEEEDELSVPDISIKIFDIPFKPNTTELKSYSGAIKILSDLIGTLKEYPQIKVIIDGHFGPAGPTWKGKPKPTLETLVPTERDRTLRPVNYLTKGRANAIIRLLINNGVDPSQLILGKGKISDKTGVEIKPKKN